MVTVSLQKERRVNFQVPEHTNNVILNFVVENENVYGIY